MYQTVNFSIKITSHRITDSRNPRHRCGPCCVTCHDQEYPSQNESNSHKGESQILLSYSKWQNTPSAYKLKFWNKASVKCLPHTHTDLRSVSDTTMKAGVVVYTCMPAVGNQGRENPLVCLPAIVLLSQGAK